MSLYVHSQVYFMGREDCVCVTVLTVFVAQPHGQPALPPLSVAGVVALPS